MGIRLLEICPLNKASSVTCNLRVFSLDEAPPYCALSYTWGDDIVSKTITINGENFGVRQNLWAFLYQRSLECKEGEWLWIDAICIDQLSLDEKNTQVPIMDKIFRGAALVYVWLGPGTEMTAKALRFLERASWNFGSETLQEHHDGLFGSEGYVLQDELRSLFRRRYWTRTWIVQEFLLAAEVIICCGSYRIPWDMLYFFCNSRSTLHTAMNVNAPSPAYRPIFGSLADVLGRDREQRLTMRPLRLSELLDRYDSTNCSDFRDKVHAFLGLASDITLANGFRPVYAADRWQVLLGALECQRQIVTRPEVAGSGWPRAQDLALSLCRALEIDGKDYLWDKLDGILEQYRSTILTSVPERGFQVSAGPNKGCRIIGVRIAKTAEGRRFSYVKYEAQFAQFDPTRDGLGNTDVKEGDLIYSLKNLETAFIGLWEGPVFRVVSRFLHLRSLPAILANSVESIPAFASLDQSIFTGRALQATLQKASVPEGFHGFHEVDVQMFSLDYRQFLDEICFSHYLHGA